MYMYYGCTKQLERTFSMILEDTNQDIQCFEMLHQEMLAISSKKMN